MMTPVNITQTQEENNLSLSGQIHDPKLNTPTSTLTMTPSSDIHVSSAIDSILVCSYTQQLPRSNLAQNQVESLAKRQELINPVSNWTPEGIIIRGQGDSKSQSCNN